MVASVRFLLGAHRTVRSLYCGIGHAAEHHQKQCCGDKCASPYPIFDHAGITFARHNAHRKLTQGADVNVQKKTRRPPDRRPKHVGAKRDSRYAVKIIQKARCEKWMQLTQQNNLPALAFYRRPQCAQGWVTGKFLLKPSSGDTSA